MSTVSFATFEYSDFAAMTRKRAGLDKAVRGVMTEVGKDPRRPGHINIHKGLFSAAMTHVEMDLIAIRARLSNDEAAEFRHHARALNASRDGCVQNDLYRIPAVPDRTYERRMAREKTDAAIRRLYYTDTDSVKQSVPDRKGVHLMRKYLKDDAKYTKAAVDMVRAMGKYAKFNTGPNFKVSLTAGSLASGVARGSDVANRKSPVCRHGFIKQTAVAPGRTELFTSSPEYAALQLAHQASAKKAAEDESDREHADSVHDRIERAWSQQQRFPSADEVDSWIDEGRK